MKFPVFFVATIAGTYYLHAQELHGDRDGTSPVQVRILDSQQVDLGNRTITYNLVETPVLKEAAVEKTAAVEEVAEYTPSAEELAEIQRWENMQYEYLGGGATVVDGVGTEFRVWTPDGEVVALSSIDFNFLQCLWGYDLGNVYYSVFFAAMAVTSEEFEEIRKEDPAWAAQLTNFPVGSAEKSALRVVSYPAGEAGEKAVQALRDLHMYFDANREELLAAFEDSEKVRLEEEEWIKANPPVPQDTVVNFFPIRSSHIKKAATQGPSSTQ